MSHHALAIDAGATSTWLEVFGEQPMAVDGAPRQVRIELAPDSRLTHYRLLAPGGPPDVADHLTVEIGAGACYEQRVLAAPARRFRSQQVVRLLGRGAQATLGAAGIALPQAQVDFDIALVHEADDTLSDQRIHVLALPRGKAGAQVETQVPPGRRGIQANQLLRALQRDERSAVALRPRLSICSDDVVCRHGATTAAIREDELHYLRSRGIARDDAIAILSEAFLRQMLPGDAQGEAQRLIEQVLALALQHDEKVRP